MSDRAAAVRNKFPQFRILVIGRANAGKTTLLQRVCKTTESPIVRDQDGTEVAVELLCYRPTVVCSPTRQIDVDVKGTLGVGPVAYR